LSDLVRDIKASSSKWINDEKLVRRRFYWQEGFGAFSYSRSQIDGVAKYVLNQEEHHKKRSFKQEYEGLLHKFDVEFDKRYIFDFWE
jgi:putative transposase